MIFKKAAKEIAIYAICIAVVWYTAISLIYSKQAIFGIRTGISRCLDVIIPSLFGMMLISEIIIRSGIYKRLSLILHPVAKWIFRLPDSLFFVLIMGNIAGYPVGVKLLSQLCENGSISKKTAERMSVFCFGSGPAFVLGTVGVGIFSSVRAGFLVFISCITANLIIAIIFGWFFKFDDKSGGKAVSFSPEMLVKSVESAGRSMLMICLMIVAFSYVLAVFEGLGCFSVFKDSRFEVFIRSALEISNISLFKSNLNLLPAITFLISFGGICVHIQLMAIVKEAFSLKLFFISRIPAALLAAAINFAIINLFPAAEYCMAQVKYSQNGRKSSFISGICLIFMIIIIIFQKKTSIPKKNVI